MRFWNFSWVVWIDVYNWTAHNDLLDEFGKARFGTPGPGEYNKPGAFGETVVFTTSSSYSFGIKPEGNNHPFISKQHSNAVGGNDSPGPAYNPNFKVVKKNQGKTVFTAADRDTEKLRYISQQHCKDISPSTSLIWIEGWLAQDYFHWTQTSKLLKCRKTPYKTQLKVQRFNRIWIEFNRTWNEFKECQGIQLNFAWI